MAASALSPVWNRITSLDIRSGAGCWVTTVEGDRYLDLTSGIAVTSTGHCHPHVVQAIATQAATLIHGQVNVYHHALLQPLAQRLAASTPPSIEQFFFTNSGAEATESAIKLAKHATGRPNIIVFSGSFHGRTHLAMAMTTSKSVLRAGYGPLTPGVFTAPFPDFVRSPLSVEDEIDRCVDAFRELLATQTAPHETAAVILEPVQGEGGYRPVPARFLQAVVETCREHGILFVADEVQSGFGRTGKLFAIEHYDVQPDIIVLAKGIASGLPMSAVGARAELMAKWVPGSHGGTYGGNPVACAAAMATLDVLTANGFLDEVQERGRFLRSGLESLRDSWSRDILDVRGLGLMLAIEFADPAKAAQVLGRCLDEKVILTTAGHRGAVVRWMPPLVVSADELAHGLSVFDKACAAVLA